MDRIGVTTDFSEESRAAFPAAAQAARKLSAEIQLIHFLQVPPILISPWPEVGPFAMPQDFAAEAEEHLASLAREAPAFQGLGVKTAVIRGESPESIQDHVTREKIGLLVMAAHGYSGFKRFLIGSFTERMLRAVTCPVLIVHCSPTGEAPKTFEPRRILVAHDFSPVNAPLLAAAREWARAFGGHVRLHFVIEETAGLYSYASHMHGTFKEYLAKVQTEAERRFRKMIQEEWKGINAEGVVTVGSTEEEIIRAAKEYQADLMAIGTHSRARLDRLLGGVAQKLVRKAPCPVLVVRGKS
jgi:nucleotide-binding universal stress UspA family protein